MPKHNAKNERVKRRYFTYLKEAKRQNEASVDAAAKALSRFEADTNYRDFATFRFERAIAFKKRLAEQLNRQTGEKLSKATMYSTLAHLKRFFYWLAGQPGYKSRLQYSDAEYFNLSEKEARVATARRTPKVPTLEQVKHVLSKMPSGTAIERRDRALLALALLTGARDGALASLRLKHVDLADGCIHQDAREVKTKYSKTFTTYFFPVGDEVRQIVAEWVTYLRDEKLWANDDPLFPSTDVQLGAQRRFEAAGLKRESWKSGAPIRRISPRLIRWKDSPRKGPRPHRPSGGTNPLEESTCLFGKFFKY